METTEYIQRVLSTEIKYIQPRKGMLIASGTRGRSAAPLLKESLGKLQLLLRLQLRLSGNWGKTYARGEPHAQ
ncbi:hypothetical protein QJS04_geneDACA013350 [Acorus gramineus]|uniref:Uncharacterized protein n=1 Tax=Acorus gramineus TaxID=55184 RepID=A0AAV9A989_ACOGR|nr:hypothetical protein QJS04_geneDACA013350 [Acorus gramineus]